MGKSLFSDLDSGAVLGTQTLASLGTAAIDNRASGAGCHTGAEAMGTGAANPAGFKRETHTLLLGKKVANGRFACASVKLWNIIDRFTQTSLISKVFLID